MALLCSNSKKEAREDGIRNVVWNQPDKMMRKGCDQDRGEKQTFLWEKRFTKEAFMPSYD